MYGMFGTTWPSKIAAMYVQMNVIWNIKNTEIGNKNTFDMSKYDYLVDSISLKINFNCFHVVGLIELPFVHL